MTARPFDFDAFISPIFDQERSRYELALFFTRTGAHHLTQRTLSQLRHDSGENLRVQTDSRISMTRKVCGLSIRGYQCERDEILAEAWMYAQIVHDCLEVNVDIVYSGRFDPLPPGSLVDMRC